MAAAGSSAGSSPPPAPSKAKAKWYDTTVSGALSGFAATYAKQPVQRLKWIRQVDAGAPVPYGTVLRRTLESDGVLGLFRGSLAAISRNVPHSALVYTIFPHFEQLVIEQRIATPGTFTVRSWALQPSAARTVSRPTARARTPTLTRCASGRATRRSSRPRWSPTMSG
jgi:hypothetical protein